MILKSEYNLDKVHNSQSNLLNVNSEVRRDLWSGKYIAYFTKKPKVNHYSFREPFGGAWRPAEWALPSTVQSVGITHSN